MKIAVISDIHGNLAALEAVLEDTQTQKAEMIVCAGDVPDPFRESLLVWERLQSLGVPCLRGNHEDYTVAFHTPGQRGRFDAPHMHSIGLVAQHLGPEVACSFAGLPMTMSIPGPNGHNVFVCHGLPSNNTRSYSDGLDATIEAELRALDAKIVVNGHRHVPWELIWNDKLLVSAGSVGLPINGMHRAEYVLLSHTGGAWRIEHRAVPYDVGAALRAYVESGWVDQGGPLAWLLYDELQCSERRLSTFWKFLHDKELRPESVSNWKDEIRLYLESIDRWNILKSQLSL
jgi:predicted phosphodiesterase